MAYLLPASKTDKDGNVWYFGYGSNMCKSTFEGHRGIKPKSSFPGILENY
jgi:hypothetical protein